MDELNQSPLKEGLLGLLGAIVTFLTRYFYKLKPTPEAPRTEKVILASGEIVSILFEAIEHLQADKVQVFYTANGGGIPHPGKSLYVTLLYEVFFDKCRESQWSEIQKIPCDVGFIQMINRLVSEGKWNGAPTEMEPGFWKTINQVAQIKKIFMYPILSTKTQYYYLNISWVENKAPADNIIEATCRTSAEKIKRILQEFGP